MASDRLRVINSFLLTDFLKIHFLTANEQLRIYNKASSSRTLISNGIINSALQSKVSKIRQNSWSGKIFDSMKKRNSTGKINQSKRVSVVTKCLA